MVQYIPNSRPDAMGKQVEMKFKISGKDKWFQGVITTYNGLTGNYGIYFPYDSLTIDVTLDDEDLRFIHTHYHTVPSFIPSWTCHIMFLVSHN